jgi:hypothetical protein
VATGLDRAAFDWLHAGGECLGCFVYWEPEEPGIADFGLFEYAHATDNWMSGPYVLQRRPRAPALAKDLPASVLEHAIRFEGRFAETPRLQPAELWACESWNATWLSSDMRTARPFAGREKDSRKERGDVGAGETFVFVDTPPVRPEAIRWLESDGSRVSEVREPLQGAPSPGAARRHWWKWW